MTCRDSRSRTRNDVQTKVYPSQSQEAHASWQYSDCSLRFFFLLAQDKSELKLKMLTWGGGGRTRCWDLRLNWNWVLSRVDANRGTWHMAIREW